MKQMWTSIKQNKTLIIFLITIFLIGVIFGVIYFLQQPMTIKEAIQEGLNLFKEKMQEKKTNLYFEHIIILTSIFFLSFTIIGNILSIFYIFYEGIIMGFSFGLFIYNFKISGFLYSLMTFFLNKFVFLIATIFIIIISLKITRRIIISIISKKGESFYDLIRFNILRLLIIIFFIILSDTFIYFFGSKIIGMLLFLLK